MENEKKRKMDKEATDENEKKQCLDEEEEVTEETSHNEKKGDLKDDNNYD